MQLAMWSGARASSVANAKLSNETLNARSDSIGLHLTKGGKSYSVRLNAQVREAVAAWIKECLPVRHAYVFTSEPYPFASLSRWTLHDVWHRGLARHVPNELAQNLRGLHQARHGLGRLPSEE